MEYGIVYLVDSRVSDECYDFRLRNVRSFFQQITIIILFYYFMIGRGIIFIYIHIYVTWCSGAVTYSYISI